MKEAAEKSVAFRGRRERGQATIEFLILLPLLLSVIVLIAYGGWWSYARLAAQNFTYSNCTGVSRSRGPLMISRRGFVAADQTLHFWDAESISSPILDATRLGSMECHVQLSNQTGQEPNGRWNFQKLVESKGFAFYSPFISCDFWTCR